MIANMVDFKFQENLPNTVHFMVIVSVTLWFLVDNFD